jgi:hypothetical protein
LVANDQGKGHGLKLEQLLTAEAATTPALTHAIVDLRTVPLAPIDNRQLRAMHDDVRDIVVGKEGRV